MATTRENEAITNTFVIIVDAALVESVGFLILAMYKGWASKPTPRSETARLKNKVFKGCGNDEVFLIAWIVKMFNIVAV